MPLASPIAVENAELLSTITTASTGSWVTALNLLVTARTTGGIFVVRATASTSNTGINNDNQFRSALVAPALQSRATGMRVAVAGSAMSTMLLWRPAMTTAVGVIYTFSVEWRTTGGTAQCRPDTSPLSESMTLFVEEWAQ